MFRKLLLRWQNRKLLRQGTGGRSPVPFSMAKDIGVLFSDQFSAEAGAINDFIRQLQQDGKRVRALTYFERPHSNPYAFKFDYFTKKELTPLGHIRNEKVDQFTGFSFDYLFCINGEDFLPFDIIMQRSKARFRVGTYVPDKEKYFEVMVKVAAGEPLPALINQMYQYTLLLATDEA